MKISEIIKKLDVQILEAEQGLIKVENLERLKEIAKAYRGEDEIVSFHEIAEKIKLQKDEHKIFTGWAKFDDILRGFRRQQVIVVSALTKSGKTSFLMDMTTRIKEENPLWFCFEESAEELVRKFVERGSEPPHAFSPLFLKGSSLEWIETKIVESIAKNDTRVIFIDQLDFIVPLNGDNHSLRVAQVMRDLKGIAKKWNVTIFLICHLVKAKMDSQPTLEDLKGSSSIGQEADTVILLWREMRKENGQVIITDNVNVSIQANRRTGRTGNVGMRYEDGKFFEFDWSLSESGRKAKDDFNAFGGTTS